MPSTTCSTSTAARWGSFKKCSARACCAPPGSCGAPGLEAIGQERRLGIAILRRVWDFIPYIGEVWVPFVFHFDFVDKATGNVVMTSERQEPVRDQYTVDVSDPRLDFRVAASMAVALDALQSR